MKWIFKLLDFLGDNRVTNWFEEEARGWHMLGGSVMFVLMLIAGVLIGEVSEVGVLANVALSNVAVLMVLVAVEVHGKVSYGSEFDWNDVLAGEALPLLLTVGIGLSEIL